MKMNHVGLMVGDMDKAVEFYTKALGLKIVMGNTKVKEEREELRKEIQGYKSEINDLHEKTKLIKLASSVSGSESGASAEVKLKINEYIREIDKCIGMLNE